MAEAQIVGNNDAGINPLLQTQLDLISVKLSEIDLTMIEFKKQLSDISYKLFFISSDTECANDNRVYSPRYIPSSPTEIRNYMRTIPLVSRVDLRDPRLATAPRQVSRPARQRKKQESSSASGSSSDLANDVHGAPFQQPNMPHHHDLPSTSSIPDDMGTDMDFDELVNSLMEEL